MSYMNANTYNLSVTHTVEAVAVPIGVMMTAVTPRSDDQLSCLDQVKVSYKPGIICLRQFEYP